MLSNHLCPLIIALAILTDPSIAHSAVTCEPLKISGEIGKGDFQRFRGCLERIANQIENGVGYEIRDGLLYTVQPIMQWWMESPLVYPATIFLNTRGGDVLEAMKIGSLAGDSFIHAVVEGECRSACFFIIVGAYDQPPFQKTAHWPLVVKDGIDF